MSTAVQLARIRHEVLAGNLDSHLQCYTSIEQESLQACLAGSTVLHLLQAGKAATGTQWPRPSTSYCNNNALKVRRWTHLWPLPQTESTRQLILYGVRCGASVGD